MRYNYYLCFFLNIIAKILAEVFLLVICIFCKLAFGLAIYKAFFATKLSVIIVIITVVIIPSKFIAIITSFIIAIILAILAIYIISAIIIINNNNKLFNNIN
jgi:hypothetical protein